MKSSQRKFKYIPGQHLFQCMRCDSSYHSNQKMIEWTGLIVCRNCYDPKHPQEGIIYIPREAPPPSKLSPYTESTAAVCTLEGTSALCGLATAGCSIPNNLIGV